MKRRESIPSVRTLRKRLAPVFRKYGVQRAVLFGSIARGEGAE